MPVVKIKNSLKVLKLDQSTVGRLTRMDAMQAQQMAVETGRRRQEEMSRIKSALKRIENDDYGFCVRCDEEIAEKKLRHNPSMLTCIHCVHIARHF